LRGLQFYFYLPASRYCSVTSLSVEHPLLPL
jgi:hypothetical protein